MTRDFEKMIVFHNILSPTTRCFLKSRCVFALGSTDTTPPKNDFIYLAFSLLEVNVLFGYLKLKESWLKQSHLTLSLGEWRPSLFGFSVYLTQSWAHGRSSIQIVLGIYK